MDRRTINLIIVITLTACAGFFSIKVSNVARIENPRFFQFPLIIGDWHGREQAISQWAYNALETPYVFVRDYTNPRYNDPVNLSLVWFDDTNIAFHAPEACMSSKIRAAGTARIAFDEEGEHEVNKLLVEMNSSKYVMTYFFDVDGYVTTSQVWIRLRILFNRLYLKRSAATFIRVMVPMKDDEQTAIKEIEEFLSEFMPVIREHTYISQITECER